MGIEIIKVAKTAKSRIGALKARADKLAADYAQMAVTVTWHAATHGDVSLINAFYLSLHAAGQAGFKRWVAFVVGNGYEKGTPHSNYWIGFQKEAFFVRQGKGSDRSAFVSAIEELANNHPDLANFMNINPDTTPKPFDDAKVTTSLHALLKKAQGESSAATPEMVKALADAVGLFDRLTKHMMQDPKSTDRYAGNEQNFADMRANAEDIEVIPPAPKTTFLDRTDGQSIQ